MKPIPTLESASPEYGRLVARIAELNERLLATQAEQRRLYAEVGTDAARDTRRERVAALAAGIDYQPPTPVREQMAKLADEARTIGDALHELGIQLADERRRASRKIVETLVPDNNKRAARFWSLIAQAAAVHLEHLDTAAELRRAGVDPAGLHDFGRDIFGSGGSRTSDIAIDLKAAVRRGYIGMADIPGVYR